MHFKITLFQGLPIEHDGLIAYQFYNLANQSYELTNKFRKLSHQFYELTHQFNKLVHQSYELTHQLYKLVHQFSINETYNRKTSHKKFQYSETRH